MIRDRKDGLGHKVLARMMNWLRRSNLCLRIPLFMGKGIARCGLGSGSWEFGLLKDEYSG